MRILTRELHLSEQQHHQCTWRLLQNAAPGATASSGGVEGSGGGGVGGAGLQQLLSSGLDLLDQPGPPIVELSESGAVLKASGGVVTPSVPGGVGVGVGLADAQLLKLKGELNQGDLNKLFRHIWEKQTAKEESAGGIGGGVPNGAGSSTGSGVNATGSQIQKGVKRKIADMIADSTNSAETDGHVSTTSGGNGGNSRVTSSDSSVGGAGKSELSQRNTLLTQLLSGEPKKEHSVNTQHTLASATAVATPQTRLPKDLTALLGNRENNNNNNMATQNKQEGGIANTTSSVLGMLNATSGVGGRTFVKTPTDKKMATWDAAAPKDAGLMGVLTDAPPMASSSAQGAAQDLGGDALLSDLLRDVETLQNASQLRDVETLQNASQQQQQQQQQPTLDNNDEFFKALDAVSVCVCGVCVCVCGVCVCDCVCVCVCVCGASLRVLRVWET